jgi:hypothetical protein
VNVAIETGALVRGVRSRPLGRFLAGAFLLLALGAGLFGARLVASNGGPAAFNPFQPHSAAATATSKVPTSSAIETAWGIRFTAVHLLADGGMVEVRYEVVDSSKGGRIHRDQSLKDLPMIVVEPSGQVVTSRDLMFHVHHSAAAHDEGRAYSIVYGNAGSAVKPGSWVTIRMSDGLQLQHVPVTV